MTNFVGSVNHNKLPKNVFATQIHLHVIPMKYKKLKLMAATKRHGEGDLN